MGSCGGTARLPIEEICPNEPNHQDLEKMYFSHLSVKHANNLNNKYSYLYRVDETIKVGKNIRETAGYFSKVPLEEIRKKRKEFWGIFTSCRNKD